MSKRAEEAQASAILPESIISYAKEHAVLSGLVYREGVKYGYEQAEKDLALTWEDIRAIDELLTLVYDPDNEKDYYTRVLEEFNKRRQDK
jgi:hypothetical protein